MQSLTGWHPGQWHPQAQAEAVVLEYCIRAARCIFGSHHVVISPIFNYAVTLAASINVFKDERSSAVKPWPRILLGEKWMVEGAREDLDRYGCLSLTRFVELYIVPFQDALPGDTGTRLVQELAHYKNPRPPFLPN